MTTDKKLENSRRTALGKMIGQLDDYQLERGYGPVSLAVDYSIGTRTFRLIVTEGPRQEVKR